MITYERPNVEPSARYGMSEAARKLKISRTTLLKYVMSDSIKTSIRKNNRRCILGSDILEFWNAY